MTTSDGAGASPSLAVLSAEFGRLVEVLCGSDGGLTPEGLVLAAARGTSHVACAALTTIKPGERPRTVAGTDRLAYAVDQIQYQTGEGPCLDAADGDDMVRADDLTVDARWPHFSPRVVAETPVRSMFAVRLRVEKDLRAALNFYASEPGVLTDDDMAAGVIFASFVSLAVRARQHENEAANLNAALKNSRQIGTAIGILMARGALTSEEAFDRLRVSSQRLNRKLREVAAEVVHTGQLPPADRGR